MRTELLNHTMHDGSRQFAALPESQSFDRLRDHLKIFNGAVVTEFLTDGVTEVWIDFVYRRHCFTVNNQFGEYWFFVADPNCPDEVLTEVVSHCETLLQDSP